MGAKCYRYIVINCSRLSYWGRSDETKYLFKALHSNAANKNGEVGTTDVNSSPEVQDSHYVLGDTLRPMLTNVMGSAIEIFDNRGIPDGGPPTHKHAWEEICVVRSGEMEVVVDGKTTQLGPGAFSLVPANTLHGDRTLDHTHFLTIVSKGNASKFFEQVAEEVEMNPPDIPGVLRIGASHGDVAEPLWRRRQLAASRPWIAAQTGSGRDRQHRGADRQPAA